MKTLGEKSIETATTVWFELTPGSVEKQVIEGPVQTYVRDGFLYLHHPGGVLTYRQDRVIHVKEPRMNSESAEASRRSAYQAVVGS